MEHDEATQTNAAERYMLGEMTETETESFEEHYFDCFACASDVRDEVSLVEFGRELTRDARTPAHNVVPLDSRRPRRWPAFAVAAVLVIGVGAPMLLMNRDRSPAMQPARLLALQIGVARGANDNVATLDAGEALSLLFDVPFDPDARYPRYEVTVRDARGTAIGNDTLTAAQVEAGESFNQVLRAIPAGTYALTIEGVRGDGSRAVVLSQGFEVRQRGPGNRETRRVREGG